MFYGIKNPRISLKLLSGRLFSKFLTISMAKKNNRKIYAFFRKISRWKLLSLLLVLLGFFLNIYGVDWLNQVPNRNTLLNHPKGDVDYDFLDTENQHKNTIKEKYTNLSSRVSEAFLDLNNSLNSAAPLVIPQPQARFGHLPYQDAVMENLIVVSSYGQYEYQRFEKLMPEAAFALMKMVYAARDDGVWVVLASAFRSYEQQAELFEMQIQRRGSPEEAARAVAPPGYSEHHTGYAVDLVDGSFPEADINGRFLETPAFQWLMQNAKKFGYELSFPENNPQGVQYEPWHWRFVGSLTAQTIFEQTME